MTTQFFTSRKWAWMAWIITSIFYAYQYVLRVMPSIFLQDISDRFHMDAAQFGQFSGIYYISYSLMHIPMGIWLDRYGPRKVMTLSIFLTIIGLLSIVGTTNPIYPIIGRFLLGFGSSAAILGVFKIVRMVFAEEKFSRMLSFSVTIGLLGAIYGGGPVSYMKESLGYEKVVFLFSVVGVALAAITFWLIPKGAHTNTGTLFSNLKQVFGNAKVICLCLFAGLMVGPLEGFADVWGTIFLQKAYGMEKMVASSLPSSIFLGMCLGAPLLSLVAEKTKNYLGTIILAAAVMVASFVLLLIYTLPSIGVLLLFILIGICCGYQILAIYKASTYVAEEVAGLTTALANMIIMVFGYVIHTSIGSIVKMLGGPENVTALSYGISVIPIALAVGGIGCFWLLWQDKRVEKTA